MSAPKKKAKAAAKRKPAAKAAPKKAAAAKPRAAVAVTTTVSRETLNNTVTRSVAMLRAIGTSDAIRAAMASRGYDNAEHERAWGLVHRASGYEPGSLPPPSMSGAAGEAIAHIDAEDESTFRLVKATLTHRFPAQAEFLLKGLTPAKGARAVVTMRQLLDRLDALDHGKGREETRADDQAALAVLARRGVSEEFRKQMRAEVRTAETFDEVAAPRVDTTAREEKHLADLQALRAWYEEWSEIARIAVTRKDLLIRMGLAQRKAPKAKASGGEPKPTEP